MQLLSLWIQPVYPGYTCGVQALSCKSQTPSNGQEKEEKERILLNFYTTFLLETVQIQSKPEQNLKIFFRNQLSTL